MLLRSLLPGFVALIAISWSLAQQPVPPDHAEKMAKGTELFKSQVRSVLIAKCLKCHGGDRTESEFDLTDREHLLKGGTIGKAIVPNQAEKSLLWQMVAHKKEPFMPHERAKLPQKDIDNIAKWIDLGAPYDEPLVKREDTSAWTKKKTPDAAKEFWSFQPLKKFAPPKVQNEKWIQTPIDRFILAPLEAKQIAPNPSATKVQLIRRAYFGLIGLPPPADEVEAFLNDPAPDAYEKVVDKLLLSPHYGERWGRHWLDLVRFGESHGFEHDYDRPNAYHYRDFVIQALNRDMPYDQFVKWQLAGDEFAPNDPLALMATGYLAAGVHSTQITANEVEKHRYDEMDDMLATTGTAMLGLTFGCARCHDHKFDPIPQADYYRMLSTFTTTIRADIDVDMDSAGYQKAKAKYDQDHAPFIEALTKFEKEQLPARLVAWEKERNGKTVEPWRVLDMTTFKSNGGATITKQGDGSLIVNGKAPPIDTYVFTATITQPTITAIRLEALSDPSLIKGGPGRAANGNFALTNFTITMKAEPIKIASARATFDQPGLPITASIDADPVTSGWAVDPQFGKDHAAIFELESPINAENGVTLTFTLTFSNNVSHSIGRPRLSVTSLKDAPLQGNALPIAVETALRATPEKRTPEQQTALLKWYRDIDPEGQKLVSAEKEHAKQAPKPSTVKVLVSTEGVQAVRLHTQGGDFLPETHFLKRGDTNAKDGVATPSYLQVLMNQPESKWEVKPPPGVKTSYRRQSFANWMTDTNSGAGKLLARVIVNRMWQHHMGRGLVATPSDFGTRGEKPTHPELLDFLADQLIANGWKLKPIHKMIVLSATYQQSSKFDDTKAKLDKDNQLWWRHPVTRLEAETIRDSLLSVSGTLDTKMFGPGTLDESSRRRSIYFTMKRSRLIPSLIIFDAPDGTVGVGDRATTTIAPQALHLLNSPQVRGYAQGLAKKITLQITSLADAVNRGYWNTFNRRPTTEELNDGIAFLTEQEKSYTSRKLPNARELAIVDFCHVLLCLNEFVYVE